MALINCPECDKEVSATAVSCPYCGYGVKKHFDDIENERMRQEREVIRLQKKEKTTKTLKVVIPIIVVVVFVIMAIAINNSILSSRKTFENDDKMLEYLTSYRSWKLDNDYNEEYLVFYNDNLSSLLTDGIMNGGEKIILHPKRGYFERDTKKYIILKSGDIVNSDKTDYYKPFYSKAPLEDGYSVLDIEVLSSKLENGNLETEYRVTNNGKKSYHSIILETVITLSDDSKLILSDFEYVLVDDDEIYLRPGKSGTTTAIGKNIPDDAQDFEVYIKSYGTEYKFN